MLSGDSITQGFTGGYGSWRSWLWRELVRTGRAPQVDFVGPRNTSAAPGVLLRNDFDPDHAALIGTRLATQATLINDYVTTYQPDVLVTLLGHNDLNHGATPAAVEASMRDYIANARAAKPDIRIVARRGHGRVLPRRPHPTVPRPEHRPEPPLRRPRDRARHPRVTDRPGRHPVRRLAAADDDLGRSAPDPDR